MGMFDVVVVFVTSYIIISELIAIINFIHLYRILENKTKKEYPVMYIDELHARIFMFALLIWLPCMIKNFIFRIYKEFK